jgi:predicted DCC family thiol-disulfide oxidoreductase YuxK
VSLTAGWTGGWSGGWSGGQYSLYRALFGVYLFAHFAQLLPWGAELFSNRGVLPQAAASPLIHLFPNLLAVADGPAVVAALLATGAAGALLFAAGLHDRWAAGVLWYIWACLYGRNPLISNPSLPYVGWLLLAHVFVAPAPYGSWAARGRLDPGGGWRLAPELRACAWLLMAVGYSYSGLTKLASPSWLDGSALAHVLHNPLARPGWLRDFLLAAPAALLRAGSWGALAFEIGFAPLALLPSLRPLLWGAMLAMHLSLMTLVDFADLSLGMAMLHLFTFDPAWLPGRARTAPDRVFYDGECGLCHGTVRFLLAEDVTGERFRFAPLQSEACERAIDAERRSTLPDSVIVLEPDGTLRAKSQAVLHLLRSLGGYWRALAALGRIVPTPWLDAAYDAVARVRRRLFRQPAQACPLLPPALRARFLD